MLQKYVGNYFLRLTICFAQKSLRLPFFYSLIELLEFKFFCFSYKQIEDFLKDKHLSLGGALDCLLIQQFKLFQSIAGEIQVWLLILELTKTCLNLFIFAKIVIIIYKLIIKWDIQIIQDAISIQQQNILNIGMQTNFKMGRPQYLPQTLEENDFVRNSLQKQYDKLYDESNNYNKFGRSTSPAKTLYPYQNLVSPKNHLNTPFFSSPYGKANSNNLNIKSAKQHFANTYEPNQYGNNMKGQNKYFEMQTTISQLKISLHQSLDSQNRLQQQLHHQKTKNFQLFQLKRRLQEQLSKMQFQLDRINSYQILQQREAIIKKQSVQAQNQSLSRKMDDLHQQLKKIKKQHRELMSEYNNSINQCQAITGQNKILIEKIGYLQEELNYSKAQIRKQFKKDNNNQNKSSNDQNSYNYENINQISTTRTAQQDNTHIYSPNKFGEPSPNFQKKNVKFYNSPPTTKPNSNGQQSFNKISEQENSRLLQDYQKLLMQNQSMKKLCEEFYQQKTKQGGTFAHQSRGQRNELNQYDKQMLKTYQRNKLQSQVSSLRQQVIQELLYKYYQKTVKQSNKNKKNCLIVFIHQISSKIQVLDRMVLNYLMARDILNKQTKNHQQSINYDLEQTQFHELTLKVKQNLKAELKKNKQKTIHKDVLTLNINSYFLALFRLLTLIYRGNSNSNPNRQANKYLKHLSLKYLHKIAQQRRKM